MGVDVSRLQDVRTPAAAAELAAVGGTPRLALTPVLVVVILTVNED